MDVRYPLSLYQVNEVIFLKIAVWIVVILMSNLFY